MVEIPQIDLKSRYKKLLERLQSLDWTWVKEIESLFKPSHTILRDYFLFILCKVIFNDQKRNPVTKQFLLSPTVEIDALWHQHILRPSSYYAMCTAMTKEWYKMNQGSTRGSTTDQNLLWDNWIIDHSPESAEDPKEVKLERIATFKALAQNISPRYAFYCRHLSTSTYDYQVIIKSLSRKEVSLHVDPSFSIADVKRLLQDKEGISVYLQRLVYSGMLLDDLLSLSDYNIDDNSTIHLVLRLTGC